VTALLLALALATSPIDIAVSSHVGTSPMAIRITVTVEPNPSNRKLCILWDSDNYSGSSCQTVDGEHFPRTTSKALALTSGTYTFRATVDQVDGKTRVSMPMTVEVQ
jgi:hypothetical protein